MFDYVRWSDGHGVTHWLVDSGVAGYFRLCDEMQVKPTSYQLLLGGLRRVTCLGCLAK